MLGSRAYVKDHFADRETMTLKPEHAKLAAYFNMDNGGGAFRGIYMQNNDAAAAVVAAWMEPFRSLGMTTMSPQPTGGTDHQAFDAVGLPGFQFIQDPMEYSTRTHHTNQDVYERLMQDDLQAERGHHRGVRLPRGRCATRSCRASRCRSRRRCRGSRGSRRATDERRARSRERCSTRACARPRRRRSPFSAAAVRVFRPGRARAAGAGGRGERPARAGGRPRRRCRGRDNHSSTGQGSRQRPVVAAARSPAC